MHIVTLALSAFAILLAGCSKLPAATSAVSGGPQPVIADVAKSFKTYKMITDRPVFVNPELAMLCRGASQDEVEAARGTKGPHAHTAIVIYMNDAAARTFASGAGSYEPGAVIVKEKHMLGLIGLGRRSKGDPDGVGGMIKRLPGFDPEHGDWEYFYFEDPEKIETGTIASCVKCHEAAKKKDHVFGAWASHPEFSQRLIP